MKNVFILTFTLLIFSSCAVHSGMMTGNASITNANFKYVGIAKGQASTTHILGIGGLNRTALVFDAKKDLFRNNPLKEGQALANVSVDFKRTFIFLVYLTHVTVTADVIDFNNRYKETSFDSSLVNSYVKENSNSLGMALNDSVYFVSYGSIEKGEIFSIGNKNAEIKYATKDGSIYEKVISFDNLLLKEPSMKRVYDFGFNVNETVIYLNKNGAEREGVIFGINSAYVGIKYNFKANGDFEWRILPIGRIQKLH